MPDYPQDYARLFNNFYDSAQGSRIDRMVAKSKMTQDPLLDASIDTEIGRRVGVLPDWVPVGSN